MDPALPLLDISIDSPWFVNVAAEPLLKLLELHPHLNVTTLARSPPPTPFRLDVNRIERRGDCYSNSNTNGNPNPNTSSGPSVALIAGIVGAVVGVLALLILAWFLWRRSKKRKTQKQEPPFTVNNNVGVQPPMPTPYDHQGMNSGTPPMMKQTGGYDMNQGGGMGPGPNYTPAIYPAPPSTSGGWSSSNTNTGSAAGLIGGGAGGPNPQDRQSYYNYAPPPSETSPGGYNMPNPAQYNHNSTLGPGGTMYSGTPSPPPPSATPGASSISGYAPWAIPHSTSPGPGSSTAGASSSAGSPPPGAKASFGGFPTAADEKAHYSGVGGKNPSGFPGFPGFPSKEEPRVGGGGEDLLGTSPPARMSVQTPAPPAYSAYTGPPQQ